MLRDRLLRPRWLVHLIVAWGVAIAAVPHIAESAPVPPSREAAGPGDLGVLRAALESRIVRDRLASLGVSPADAETVLERLSPAERTELASRVDELGAGAGGVEFLALAIILALVVILVLELLGRRVISKP